MNYYTGVWDIGQKTRTNCRAAGMGTKQLSKLGRIPQLAFDCMCFSLGASQSEFVAPDSTFAPIVVRTAFSLIVGRGFVGKSFVGASQR